MKRVLLIGAGEVGSKHLDVLRGVEDLALVGVADPAAGAHSPAGVPLLASWQTALDVLEPDVLVVATPPGIALDAARAAAARGARVLVEKPTTLHLPDLEPEPSDRRIFVAFQPHFAPGLTGLLNAPPAVRRAEVTLACHRDRPYYRTWRARWATSGGVLHQQAIHGLALALRILPPGPVISCTATVRRERQWAESEDQVSADVAFQGGERLIIDARVDSDRPPHHHVVLHLANGQRLHVRGRNLEAGVGALDTAPDHRVLRQAMYRALVTSGLDQPHPSLFPLSALRRTLEVIDHVYRTAHDARPARPAA